MKPKNISTLERAIGVLEGIKYGQDNDKLNDCLFYVIDMIGIVLTDEGGRNYDE